MHVSDAYKTAAEGLRVSREEGGVSIESVEDAVENFQAEVRNVFRRYYTQ